MTKKMFVLSCFFCSTTLLAQTQTPSSAAPNTNPTQDPPGTLTASVEPDGDQKEQTTLHRRPVASEPADSEAPVPPGLHPAWLTGTETIPRGMVWVPTGNQWTAREINSCNWCSKPMTFRRAALDNKAIGMWAAALALTVADIEGLASRHCINARTCREGNPLLGQTRTQQYALRLPILAGAWIGTAWLRKGNQRLHVGGMKRWWILPMLYQATSSAGVAANLARGN
jgi:hypothetical protein